MTLEERKRVLSILKSQDLNLVPIPIGRGKALPTGWPKWCDEKCEKVILDNQDFAIMTGVTSDGLFTIDIEIKNVTEEYRQQILLPILEEILSNCLDVTLVVKTGNGYHIHLKTNDHILRSFDLKKDGITLEIKGQGKYVVGPSSRHYDQDQNGEYHLSGKTYEIISNTTQIKTVSSEDFLNDLFKKGWSKGSFEKPVKELYGGLYTKGEGSNRQGDLIRILSSLKIKNPEFNIEDLRYHGFVINSQFMLPYPDGIVEDKIRVSWDFANDVLSNRLDQILVNNVLFEKLWNDSPEDAAKNAVSLVTMMIKVGFIVVKSKVRRKLLEWCKLHKVNPVDGSRDLNRTVKVIVDSVWNDGEKFQIIKKKCHELGILEKPIIFDKDQIAEAGEWVKGRHRVKKLGLTGEIIYFNERHYDRDSKEFISRVSAQCLTSHNNNSIKEVVGYIERTSEIIDNDSIKKHAHLKCLLNGTYNIKTGKFVESFDPNNIILNLIPHNFDEDASYEEIKRIVSEIIISEQDRQQYYDFGSICLHPYTGIDFQLGLVGIPGAGKGQLGILYNITFGSDNVSDATIHSIAHDDTIQQDVAYDFLNIDQDMSSQSIGDVGVLKKWITQDMFRGRAIYVHSIKFQPSARLMFVANGLYEISKVEDALAMYERTILLKLNQKFRHEKGEIKRIVEKIDGREFDGFITYLLKNATEIFEMQGIHYPQSTAETERIWNEHGNDVRKFVEKWVERGNFKTHSGEFWNRWQEHANDNAIAIKGRNQFYEAFDDIVGQEAISIRDGIDSYHGYFGLRVRSYDELTEQKRLDETPKGKVLLIIGKMVDDDVKFEGIEELLR